MKYCSKCGYQMADDMLFCQQCGTKFVPVAQTQVSSNTSTVQQAVGQARPSQVTFQAPPTNARAKRNTSERITMNTALGTKWFTFYTKVRPWFVCILCLPSFIDLVTYSDVYFTHPGLLLSVFGAAYIALLSVFVFVKSRGDYGEFVDFVRIVLIIESITYSYNMIIQEYYERKLDTVEFIIYVVLSLLIFYFLWYRLSMKYFKKRLTPPMPITQAPQQPIVYEEPHICLSNVGEQFEQRGNYNYYSNLQTRARDVDFAPSKDMPHPPVQYSLSNIDEEYSSNGKYFGNDIAYTPAPEVSPKITPPINK